jgi:hypothetical protein
MKGALWFWVLAATVTACRASTRCGACGMRVDPGSAWVAYVMVQGRELPFDTPHCAFVTWRRSKGDVSAARFREYYSQQMKPAAEVRFVAGSDVVGPMGPDLVPVATDNASRFARDHNGASPKTAEQIVEEGAP